MARPPTPPYLKDFPNPYFSTSSQMSPYFLTKPASIAADKKGLSEGELLLAKHEEAAKLKKTQEILQTAMKEKDNNLDVLMTSFQNWSGSIERSLLLYVKPTSRSQICDLVEKVANTTHEDGTQIKIGMGGAYHTWSPMFPDECGVLINTCDLTLGHRDTLPDGFIASDVWPDTQSKPGCIEEKTRIILHTHRGGKVVTISPGVTTGELMEFFLKYNVCFESDVILATVTYGGVLSGGCHGVGVDQQSMSDWIVSMTVVNGKGEKKVLKEVSAHEKGNDLLAGQTSLGVLGVALEYTVKVQEMSYCRVQNDFDMRLGNICTTSWLRYYDAIRLGKLFRKHWSVEVFWFPFNSIIEALLAALPSPSEPGADATAKSSKPEATVPVLTSGKKLEEIISDYSQLTSIEDVFGPSRDEPEPKPPKGYKEDEAEEKEEGEEQMGSSPGKSGLSLGSLDIVGLLAKLWCPQFDKLWIRAIDIIRKPHQTENHRLSREPGVPAWSKLMDLAVHAGGNVVFGQMQKSFPEFTPFALGIGFQGVKLQYGQQADEIVRTPWAIHYRDAIDLMPVTDLEFSFPINIDFPIRAVDAIRKVMDITKDFAWGKQFPLTLCLEMRVMSRSDAFLCPASIKALPWEDHIAYIEILGTTGTPGYGEYVKRVADAWTKLGGVPHWQKEFYNVEGIDREDLLKHMRKKYGKENINKFNNVRKRLDENDIFLNNAMKTFLYPETHCDCVVI